MTNLALLRTKLGLAVLLTGLFTVNYVETQLEEYFKGSWEYTQGFRNARAFQEMEGGFQFAGQALAPVWSIAGFSLSYFVLFPLLMVGIAVAFWRRPSIRPLRVFSLSLTINYFLSLPFFLFFPVPERWAYPGSDAILISDLLSTQLIEVIRPISGLDNCFPSVHTSFSVLAILSAYWFDLRLRHSILFLALTVVLSTFALGIHWGPDIVMGTAAAILSFAFGVMVDRRFTDVRLPTTSEAETEREPNHQEAEASEAAIERELTEPPDPAIDHEPTHLKTLIRDAPIEAAEPAIKAAFISYRRELGSQYARIVQAKMADRGSSCFLDVDDLGPVQFDARLLKEIEQAPNFILILTPGSLDRCSNDDDWLRKEIVHAIKHQKNILPLLVDGFRFPDYDSLPEDMQRIVLHNGVDYSHTYIEATFDKLQKFMMHE